MWNRKDPACRVDRSHSDLGRPRVWVLVLTLLALFSGPAFAALEAGQELPSFGLPLLQETSGSTTLYLDKVFAESTKPATRAFLLVFYASWCEPCQKELPRWKAMTARFGAEGLALWLVDIDTDASLAKAREIMAREKPSYAVLSDRLEVLSRRFFDGRLALPTALLVDGARKIVKVYGEKSDWTALEADVQALLAKSAPAKAATPETPKQQGIVVWRLEKKEGVKDSEIDSISNTITTQVAQYSGAKVISEADIRTVLKGAETRQRCGMEDTHCVAEVGTALGVPESVSGDIGKVGGFWMLNLRRINVKTSAVIGRSNRSIEGSLSELLRHLPGAVAELFGKEAPALEAPPPETKVYPMDPYPLAGHATFWSGLGLVGIGGIAAWQAKAKAEDYDAGKRGAKSQSKAWTGTMYGLFGVGGAAMITGVVLWAVAPSDKDWAEAHPLAVAPLTDGRHYGLFATLAW